MPNIVDYVRQNLATFDESPMCQVDSLVLSWFSYLRLPEAYQKARSWQGIALRDLFCAEHFDEMLHGMWDVSSSMDLLTAMVASPRFRDARVMGYTERLDVQAEQQFAAVTLQLTPELAYAAFRGTDATVVGWKEDFNLAFTCPVPSQEEAARYAAAAAGRVRGAICLGGHSKGGNLAVYAAAKAPSGVRERIETAYSHDGPGFMESVLEDPDFVAVAGKVDKTIPQSSIVGMLLENQERFSIVRSTGRSFTQHDPFTWEVEDGAFVAGERLTADAVYVDKTLSEWVASMTVEQREQLLDTLYEVLVVSVADDEARESLTTGKWYGDLGRNFPTIASSVAGMDKPLRDTTVSVIGRLLSLAARNVPGLFREAGRQLTEGVQSRLSAN